MMKRAKFVPPKPLSSEQQASPRSIEDQTFADLMARTPPKKPQEYYFDIVHLPEQNCQSRSKNFRVRQRVYEIASRVLRGDTAPDTPITAAARKHRKKQEGRSKSKNRIPKSESFQRPVSYHARTQKLVTPLAFGNASDSNIFRSHHFAPIADNI